MYFFFGFVCFYRFFHKYDLDAVVADVNVIIICIISFRFDVFFCISIFENITIIQSCLKSLHTYNLKKKENIRYRSHVFIV